MLNFLAAIWWRILFLPAMFWVHAGHGGHGGGCGGGRGDSGRNASPAALTHRIGTTRIPGQSPTATRPLAVDDRRHLYTRRDPGARTRPDVLMEEAGCLPTHCSPELDDTEDERG